MLNYSWKSYFQLPPQIILSIYFSTLRKRKGSEKSMIISCCAHLILAMMLVQAEPVVTWIRNDGDDSIIGPFENFLAELFGITQVWRFTILKRGKMKILISIAWAFLYLSKKLSTTIIWEVIYRISIDLPFQSILLSVMSKEISTNVTIPCTARCAFNQHQLTRAFTKLRYYFLMFTESFTNQTQILIKISMISVITTIWNHWVLTLIFYYRTFYKLGFIFWANLYIL